MDLFPLIHVKHRRLLESPGSDLASYQAMLKPYKDTVIYLLDMDGIEKNRPNLDLYQLLAGTYTLWVDAGPRKLGDVVDILMGGASRLTIRPDRWDIIDLIPIRDLTESPLYISVTAMDSASSRWDVPLDQADGVVTFLAKAEYDLDFKQQSYFKELCRNKQLYAYETQTQHSTYWKYLGAKGLLVDINKVEEFKGYGV
jgi:hypothetical protein